MRRRLIAGALAAAVLAAVAAASLRSTEAVARSEQASPACSEPALTLRNDPQPRPTYGSVGRQLAGRRVVVHYARSGAQAPSQTDRAPKNGIPDYAERVRDAGDASLAFFAAPRFNGAPFPGFDTTFSDTGGPDSRLDIYVTTATRGAYGRTATPGRAEGGAFVMVSPTLVDQPRKSRKRFRGNGIRFTVAHELFHIVQFGYVPTGIPLWAAEGTANTMAFFFEQADRLVQTEADDWLRRPDCALWYQGFNCDRCYGGIWFWAAHRALIRPYFEHFAQQLRAGRPVGSGVAPLESAFQSLAANEVFVTPYLFLSFGYVFAPAQAALAYARSKGRLGVKASIVARPATATSRMTLNPLSAHFISVRAPAGASALELVATGIDQPDPLQTLLVGAVRRGRSVVVTREVAPCITVFPGPYATFSDVVRVNYRSARERARSILVVANRTNRVVPYTLSYRSLARPVADPSPTQSLAPKGPLPPNLTCKSPGETGTDSDPTGDAGVGAPDLTNVRLTLANSAGNSRPLYSFTVDIPNRRDLRSGDQILMLFDTDKNANTGCLIGAERGFLVGGAPGPDVHGSGRCVGGELVFDDPPRGTFQARYDETNRRLVVVATPSDVENVRSFAVTIAALWRDPESGEVRLDATASYCFPTTACGGRSR